MKIKTLRERSQNSIYFNLADYPACSPDVKSAGGIDVDIPVDQAIVDSNLVTAPAWPAHPNWLAEFLIVLGTKIEHPELATVV